MTLQINKTSSGFMLVRTSVKYKTASASIFHAMCQYDWLSKLISRYTFRPLMKVEERYGVPEHQRQSQEQPFIVPAHAPLQIDFLQQPHAHATRPQLSS